MSCFCQWKRLAVSTDVNSENHKRHPQDFDAAHPEAFKVVIENYIEGNREHEPSPTEVAVCHTPNSVEGCEDKDYEESIANIAQLQHRVIIAAVGIRHAPDPAWSVNDARRVGSYKPKGLISPSKEWAARDLSRREIPYRSPAREGRIAVQEV